LGLVFVFVDVLGRGVGLLGGVGVELVVVRVEFRVEVVPVWVAVG
jgi:hypothetical protein